MFAARKIHVHGVDVNQKIVDTINAGEVHIIEPDLDIAVRTSVEQGFLKASCDAKPTDAFIIAVPTPFKDGFEPDLSYIKTAAEKLRQS